jgi:hypothetical protein
MPGQVDASEESGPKTGGQTEEAVKEWFPETFLLRCRRVLNNWQVAAVLLPILALGVAIDSCIRR